MSLATPIALLLLVPVALLGLAYLVQQRRRGRYAVRFAAAPLLPRVVPRRPAWRRHVAPAALLLAFALLSLAAARPEMDVRVPREEATIVVTLDVSASMRAQDVEPSRLAAAADAAARFVETLPDTMNVGVVTFSSTATVLTQPTTDHRRVVATLGGLETQLGTGIGEGLFASLQTIRTQEQVFDTDDVPARIVLLSDGQNTVGRPPEAAAVRANRDQVPVSTIAYGASLDGQSSRETLEGIAETTGGAAYDAEDATELDGAYDDIAGSIGWTTEHEEVTPYLAVLALLLGLAGAAASLRWFARIP